MRSHWKAAVFACVFAVAQLTSTGPLFAAEEEEAVSAAMAQFYSALNALFKGEMEPMEQVWSHAADVTYMGPGGGMQVGWDAVGANWRTQASLNLGGEVKADRVQMHVGQDIAVTSGYEVGENVVGGQAQQVSIRATNIFRKENGQWKMIGHHADLLPYLEQ